MRWAKGVGLCCAELRCAEWDGLEVPGTRPSSHSVYVGARDGQERGRGMDGETQKVRGRERERGRGGRER